LGSFAKWRDEGFPPYPIDLASGFFLMAYAIKIYLRLADSELAFSVFPEGILPPVQGIVKKKIIDA